MTAPAAPRAAPLARPRLALTAGLGLAALEGVIALTLYRNAAVIAAALLLSGAFLVAALRQPKIVAYVALGWMFLEKTAEPHLPISSTTVDHVGDGVLALALAWTLFVNLLRRRQPLFTMRQIGVPLVAFMLLGVISTIVNGVPLTVAGLGILSTVHSIIIFLVFLNIGLDLDDAQSIVGGVLAVMGLASLVAILQVVPGSPAWHLAAGPAQHTSSGLTRVQGIFDHPISLGNFTAMLLPLGCLLMFSPETPPPQKILLFIANLLMLGALLLSLTRESWAALFLAALFMGIFVERKVLRAFIPLLPAIAALVLLVGTVTERLAETAQGDLRFRLLQRSLPLIRDHFWLGVGPGRFGGHVALVTNTPLYAQYKMTDFFYHTGGQIDMFWTHLVGESGALGTAAYVAIIASCFFLGRRAYLAAASPGRKALLLGLLFTVPVTVLVSFFSSELETGNSATLFWALMAILTLFALDTMEGRPVEGQHVP